MICCHVFKNRTSMLPVGTKIQVDLLGLVAGFLAKHHV